MITTWNLRHISKREMLGILAHVPGLTLVPQENVWEREYDYSGFESAYEQVTPHVQHELENAVHTCELFLCGILLTDSFKDHHERRHWRASMAHHYGEAFTELWNSNKLRLNNLSAVHRELCTVYDGMKIFKVDSARAEAIRTLKLPLIHDYDDDMPLVKKIERVAEFDRASRTFLAIMAKA